MEQKQMKKIGIIGAMELEVETLKSKMNVVKTTKKANMEFFEGTLNGVEVVIVRSGICLLYTSRSEAYDCQIFYSERKLYSRCRN